MKFRAAAALAAIFVLATSPSHAGYNDDVRACNTPNIRSRAAEAACTRLLKDVRKGVSVPVTLSLRAWARQEQGNYEGAIADANQALGISGPHKDHYNVRGLVWTKLGEYDKALADFSEGLRLAPNWGSLYINRAIIYFERREYDRAIEDLDKAIKLMPKYSVAYNNRGNVWQYKGDYERAIADYTAGIRLDAKNGQAYMNRGRTWMLKGDLDKSIADLNRAIEISKGPGNDAESPSGPYSIRGDMFRYKGDWDRALADYDASLAAHKDAVYALTGKGLTYEKMGKPELARAEFQKAVDSKSPFRTHDISLESMRTAQARLAALDSGAGLPVIDTVPVVASGATSIPTVTVQPPKPAAAKPPQGRRVALVIGNSAYTTVSALANPEKDASAVAATLRNIGFETVTLVRNATREQMVNSLRDFANEAEKSEWAMVYYAGHGMEVGGVNYLIPVDAKIAVDRDIQYEAVPLHQILNAADTARKIKIVMLDACRDNPFAPRRTAAPEVMAAASTAGAQIATRSTNGRGLAEVKVSGATLVVYAAKDGQVALDGEGGNSPFAVAVVQRIGTPGVEINKVFRLVRDDVMEVTAGRQEPYTYGSLPGREDFYFVAR